MAHVVFINYRRDDSGSEAKLIADALQRTAHPVTVFMDTESIDSGETWPESIRSALAKSRYVLVVIGPEWLRAGTNEWGQRKIDNDADWVRQEIANALSDDQKTIIPLLIRGAKMPPKSALPSDIAAVTSKQAIEIRRDYWDHDIELLLARLAPDGVRHQGDISPPKNPLFSQIWDNLSPSLQDAFVLAANAAMREHERMIATHHFFAALRRLHPERLPAMFEQIPSDALPEAVPKEVDADRKALADIRQFSGCVRDSLNHLIPQSSPTDRLTAEDVFVDIARHGTGTSVQRLRTHGVDVERINEIVGQLGWIVTERNAI